MIHGPWLQSCLMIFRALYWFLIAVQYYNSNKKWTVYQCCNLFLPPALWRKISFFVFSLHSSTFLSLGNWSALIVCVGIVKCMHIKRNSIGQRGRKRKRESVVVVVILKKKGIYILENSNKKKKKALWPVIYWVLACENGHNPSQGFGRIVPVLKAHRVGQKPSQWMLLCGMNMSGLLLFCMGLRLFSIIQVLFIACGSTSCFTAILHHVPPTTTSSFIPLPSTPFHFISHLLLYFCFCHLTHLTIDEKTIRSDNKKIYDNRLQTCLATLSPPPPPFLWSNAGFIFILNV